MVADEGILSALASVVKEVSSSLERRALALVGHSPELLAAKSISMLLSSSRREELNLLYAYEGPPESSEGWRRFQRFLEVLKSDPRGARVKVRPLEYKDTKQVMGTTWNSLVLDLFEELRPNDLGRLIETVSGGGLVIMLLPPEEEWLNDLTVFQKRLITPPYTESDIKRRFLKRFLRKLREHVGVWILDVDSGRIEGRPLPPAPVRRRRPKIPEDISFPKEIYEMAKTQDQVAVLSHVERIAEEGSDERKVLVITANRGRGKSAVLGMGVAGILSNWAREGRLRRVIVTAPEEMNVNVLFEFAKKGLEALGLKYEEKENPWMIKIAKARLVYLEPFDVPAKKRDLVIVDEAAGIPVPMLFKILSSARRIIYSSTVHGYEGAGRGFSVRFLSALKSTKGLKLELVQMTEPIRYSSTDPVERWLYDVLLLDAEPVELSEEEKRGGKLAELVTYYVPDLDRWFLGGGERELRDFIGIYILAHYRNRPDDLAILADAPHHTARAMILPSRKIVASLQLTYEGGLSASVINDVIERDYDAPGNLIPIVILKHYFIPAFGKLRGIRVVRVAVHPELMGKGIGSKALEGVEIEARTGDFDWVGASFGASKSLLSFWLKNGYLPVHISPVRNPVSGESSVIVLKPLNKRAGEVIERLNALFKVKLLEALPDVYFHLEPEVARLILRSGRSGSSQIELNEVQLMRLKMYTEERMIYEAAVDAVRVLTKKYFLEIPRKVGLTEKEELLLIAKSLQGKGWGDSAEEIGMRASKVKIKLRKAVSKIFKHYFG